MKKKTTIRRALSCILCLVMIFSTLPVSAFANTDDGMIDDSDVTVEEVSYEQINNDLESTNNNDNSVEIEETEVNNEENVESDELMTTDLEYVTVTFLDEDGTELGKTEVEKFSNVRINEIANEYNEAMRKKDTDRKVFVGWSDQYDIYYSVTSSYYFYEDVTFKAEIEDLIFITFFIDYKDSGLTQISKVTTSSSEFEQSLEHLATEARQIADNYDSENLYLIGWKDDANNFYELYDFYIFKEDLNLTAVFEEYRTLTFLDETESVVGVVKKIRNGSNELGSYIPFEAQQLLEHNVDKCYIGFTDENGNLYGSKNITADSTYKLSYTSTQGEEVEFHKVNDLTDLQRGAHYVIVARTEGETRYTFGNNNMNSSYNGAVVVNQSKDDYDKGILRLPSDAESIFTLNNFSILSDTAATVSFADYNGMRMKLGTNADNFAPLFNSAGGTITLSKASDELGGWLLSNTTRYLKFYPEESFLYNKFGVEKKNITSFDIYTDASETTLGEAHFVEYSPLGLDITDINIGEELLIIYTDENGRSYALTNGVDNKYAIPVNISSNVLVGDKVTSTITTDRSNSWEVKENWEPRSNSVSGMPSDDNLTVLRTTLNRGNLNLLVSSDTLVRDPNVSTTRVYFYIDYTDPNNPVYRLHGDDSQADRYLGWNGEDFYVNSLSFDQSISVRIFGPERSDITYSTKYVRINSLEEIYNNTTNKFVVVLPIEDTYKAMYYTVGKSKADPTTWLVDVNPEIDEDNNEFIMVDNDSLIFSATFTEYKSSSSGPYISFDNLTNTKSGYSFYPQNLTATKPDAPFRSNADSKGRFEGSTTSNEIYIRGNGSDKYLTYVDGSFAIGTQSNENRQPVQIYAPVNNDYLRVRYVNVNGDSYKTSYVQDEITLATPNDLWTDEQGNFVTKDNSTNGYVFIGWSTNEKYAEKPFLSLDESANIYDATWYFDENGDRVQIGVEEDGSPKYKSSTSIREELRDPSNQNYLDLVGPCLAEELNIVNVSEVKDSIENNELYLYPVYAVRGFDDVVSADENGINVVGVSDWKENQATGDNYKNNEREKWLGFIYVDIYKDGEIWVDSKPMYFSYHNDNRADLNIKFIWDNLVENYNNDDPLYYFMANRKGDDAWPLYDQVGHFRIDGVYAMQEDSEDGLIYEYNWMSDHGGQLDNVAGGSHVKIYVTTIYNAKFYLQDANYFEVDKDSNLKHYNLLSTTNGYVSTSGTENLFRKDTTNVDNFITKDNELNGLFNRDFVLNDSGSRKYLDGDGLRRGEEDYKSFAYFIANHPNTFTLDSSPKDLVPEGFKLESDGWLLKAEPQTIVTFSNSAAYTWATDFTVTSDKTNMAYAEESGHEAETPKTFHFYADITPEVGDIIVSKVVVDPTGNTTKTFNFSVTLSDTTINGKYGDMEFIDGITEFELADGDSLKAEDLPTNIKFTVIEKEANQDGYTTSYEYSSEIIRDKDKYNASVCNVVNKRDTGDLSITKTVAGRNGDVTKDFSFKITLEGEEINGEYGDIEFINNIAEITLKHNETKSALGLPTNLIYTVEEIEDEEYTTVSTGETGIIQKDSLSACVFTNTLDTGDLVVSKTVVGENADFDIDFEFTVTLNKNLTGKYGDMEFVDGIANFTLKHGESLVAEELPVSIEYIVEEKEVEYYVTSSVEDSGKIEKDSTKTAAFTNKYVGNPILTIEKSQSVNNSTKTTGLIQVKANDTIKYYLTIKNTGTGTAYNIVVTDEIPDGLKLVNINGGELLPDGKTIAWLIKSLEQGKEIEVSFEVSIPKVTKTTSWKNTVTMSFERPENVTEDFKLDKENPHNEKELIISNTVEIEETIKDVKPPYTGDNSNLYFWTMLLIISALGLVFITKKVTE